MSKAKKVRVELKRNRTKPPRENDLTKQHGEDSAEDVSQGERVRTKGDLSRKRTTIEADATAVDGLLPGRVLRVQGLYSMVELEDGRLFRCALKRLLKTLSTDERSILTTGDRVRIREAGELHSGGDGIPEGMIEKVEARRGTLTRSSRRREHVLVSNVDQLLIVISLKQPDLKPYLIDRYIAAAIKGDLAPVVCLNKADLVDAAEMQPLIGAYAQLGIPTVLTSARTGYGINRLRELLADRATVFSGQSGVGKSSLLNAVQPNLALRVRTVSESNDKGRHTTTTAELIKLETGGWVVDTPGVRQLQLWDTRPEEIEGYFPDFRPFVPLCGFPDCVHLHETKCAIKRAVQRRQLSARRYQSYLGLYHGTLEEE